MNILVASDAFFPDEPRGAARVPWELARRLAARGHRLQFLTRGASGKPPAETREGVSVMRYAWSALDPLGSLWSLRRALRRVVFPLDAMHVHGALSGAAARAWGGVRKPYLYFFHSPWAQEYLIRRRFGLFLPPVHYPAAWARHAVERRLLAGASAVLALSQFMVHQLRLHHGALADKAVRVRGAADTERFRPKLTPAKARAALSWAADKTILFTARGLEARMGLDNLLAAFATLRRKHASLQLYIAGGGPLRKFLERRARALGVAPAVSFLGVVPDETLALCYQAADVFVLPTRELEGFGLATVEALASGCPVVGTQVGGTAEVLKPLDPDLLAPENSPEQIAAALERLLARRKEWPELREKCAQYARRHFSWDTLTADVEKLTAALKALAFALLLAAPAAAASGRPGSPDETAAARGRPGLSDGTAAARGRPGLSDGTAAARGRPGSSDGTSRPRNCLLHVHSFVSPNGKTSLQAIASLASKRDIDVLIPTDHFLQRWEYGLPPLPGILRRAWNRSSVRRFGPERYLKVLETVRREHPRLTVVPGVEAAPAYRWSGHPAKGNLVLNEAGRTLLVLGLNDAEDIRLLPVLSNPGAGRWRWERLAAPLLVAALGLALAVRWPAGLLLAALGAGWGMNQRPFREVSSAHASFSRDGWDAAQALIDYANARGALTVWSAPEASAWAQPRRFTRSVSMATRPYPDALLETRDYTGFAYFWDGADAAGGAGGTWDRALAEYAAGRRARPVWAFAETEDPEQGRLDPHMDRARNVIWAPEGDPLAELRAGRFYAVVQPPGGGLELRTWGLKDGAAAAASGGEAAWSAGLRLEAEARAGGKMEIEVLRNGAVWKRAEAAGRWAVSLPLPEPESGRDVYRLVVREADGGRLAANPLFTRGI